MKKNIHPQWHDDCQVTCVCGNTFTTGSTYPEIQVEICSACHPFFTGEMKFVDTQGRVERFMQKRQESEAKKAELKKAQAQKTAPVEPKEDPKSFRQILSQTQNEIQKKEKGTEVKAEVKKDTKVEKTPAKSEKTDQAN